MKSASNNLSEKTKRFGFTPTPELRLEKNGAKRRRGLVWGFTLLETVVALGLITGGIAAATTLSLQAITNVAASKNKLAALNLAQEGIELVRQIRDTNEIQDKANWEEDISKGGCSESYQIDVAPGPPTLGTDKDQFLQYPDAKGVYGYSAGPDSIFKRVITVERSVDSSGNPCLGSWKRPEPGFDRTKELRIISTVTWFERNATKQVKLEEVFYDWK